MWTRLRRPPFRGTPRGPTPPSVLRAVAAALGLLLGGCGTQDDTPPEDTPPDSTPTGDPNVLVGTFQVMLVPPVAASNGQTETPGYTTVVGKIYDGPSPSQIIWQQAAQGGDCKLTTPRVPFCGTPCGGSAVCVDDDKCQAYPTARAVGTIQVKGLRTASGATGFSMSPIANNYQPPGSVSLPYPAFSEGDEIVLTAAGAYYPAFTLEGRGITPLQLLDGTLTLQRGQPLTLHWTPAGQADVSTIHVKLDISHHGGTKGMIECDTADTGSLQLPAGLVTQLLDLGVAGYPTIIVTRRSVGSVTIAPGRVDLLVSSEVERAVVVPGITSCSGNSDCPSGKTCQPDLTCG
ncbi:hypothetical protein [Cystobacter fuscus]|uniref:hypothetical protein n=1 Tax=Cystobacter fuscus TaxID=43 RepID=UPI002B2EDD1C|nr:hypothetical protein F0U63_33660 [Cystobacter fuscus]